MVQISRALAAVTAIWISRGLFVSGLPFDQCDRRDDIDQTYGELDDNHPFAEYASELDDDLLQTRQSDDVKLRILSLGASIMSGVGSSTHSGLRKWLRQALRHEGYAVNMVGSRQDGSDMVDNDHEATPGAVLERTGDSRDTIIRQRLQDSIPYRPNIVIINGGTNNANRGLDVENTGRIMKDIANDIWNAEGMSDTCIILSTLLPTRVSSGRTNRITMNGQMREFVFKTQKETNKCIWLADMEPPGEGRNFLDIERTPTLYDDDVHPNDEGHKRMAYVFYAAIRRALRANQVKKAAPKDSEASEGCDKRFGDGEFAGGNTQNGYGHHDGTYIHDSQKINEPIIERETDVDRNQWRFARLFSRDYDDFLGWFERDNGRHAYGVWKNSADGRGNFRKINDLNPDLECIPRGVHFIDMNADGLDDIVCTNSEGNAYLSINQGDGARDVPPTFKRVSSDALIMPGKGTQQRVRLADIDGDGRGDYGIIQNDGNVRFWRNGGTKDAPEFWQDLGLRAGFQREGFRGARNNEDDTDIKGVRFEDINGDGRDDYLWVDSFGRTATWTNTRSCMSGKPGDGMNVQWRKGKLSGTDYGFTHSGMRGEWESSDRSHPIPMHESIHFARIFGTKDVFGNLGLQDYVWIQRGRGSDKKYRFKVRVWRNRGQGGTKLIADGNKYCNMVGHADGRMDYVWVWSDGTMKLFPNAGKKFVNPGESFWRQDGHPDIFTPSEKLDRRDLHLADWDGDGDCDIIYVNRAGGMRIWENRYPDTGSWSNAFREINAPPTNCRYSRGIGHEDLAVRFHDLTGNGRADYLCISPDGTVTGYYNTEDGMIPVTNTPNARQFKFSEQKDRANLRWADVNGDGREDMIWIDKFNGNGHVWYNSGASQDPSADGGSAIHWRKVERPVYDGNQQGGCMYFPDLDGNKRADMHSIEGTWTNIARTWFNPSCGLRDAEGDDKEGVVDPRLPIQPGNPLDGPGPGESGSDHENGSEDSCRETDDRNWREHTCNSKFVKSDTRFTAAQQWEGLDGDGAWLSAIEFYACEKAAGYALSSFSNVARDALNGPPGMRCEDFKGSGNGCTDLSMDCNSEGPGAVTHHVLNSMSRIYSIWWNSYSAINDAVTFFSVDQMVKDFGQTKGEEMNPSVSVILDLVMIGYGMVMGPSWNKLIVPKFADKTTGGTVKDTINDLVKGGAALTKDLYNEEKNKRASDQADLNGMVKNAITDMGNAWRRAIQASSEKLWDGSSKSIQHLTNLMKEGVMMDSSSDVQVNAGDLQNQFQIAMAAFLIPETWNRAPDGFHPVVIREDIDCNTHPTIAGERWNSVWLSYVTTGAYNKRICDDETNHKSYWLLGPKEGGLNCGGVDDRCDAWGGLPGYDKLESGRYNISHHDIVLGSVNSWERNGRKNGYDMSDITNSFLDEAEIEIRAPGIFTLPVCTLSQARDHWEYVASGGRERGPHFPCPP